MSKDNAFEEMLFALVQENEGGVPGLLDKVFDFLGKHTEFYVSGEKGANEKLLWDTFQKYKAFYGNGEDSIRNKEALNRNDEDVESQPQLGEETEAQEERTYEEDSSTKVNDESIEINVENKEESLNHKSISKEALNRNDQDEESQSQLGKENEAEGERTFTNYQLMTMINKKYDFDYNITISTSSRKFGPPLNYNQSIPSDDCKIVCTNIPKGVGEAQLILHFETFGRIYSVELFMEIGTHLGIAEVIFFHETSANQALNNFNNKPVEFEEMLLSPSRPDLSITNLTNQFHRCQMASPEALYCDCVSEYINKIETTGTLIKQLERNYIENGKLNILKVIRELHFCQFATHCLNLQFESEKTSGKNIIAASEFLMKSKYLNDDILKNLHKLLMPNSEFSGRYRTEDLVIPAAFGRYRRLPIEKMDEKLSTLFQLVETWSFSSKYSSVVHASFLRMYFLDLCPFPDGNEFIADMLFNWILKSKTSHPWVIFFKDDEEGYLECSYALQKAPKGDYNHYLRKMCDIILRSHREYIEKLRNTKH